MHYKRVIPCMDVDAGRVVKGTRFLDIRDAGDPVELAAYYDEHGAADDVHPRLLAHRGQHQLGARRGLQALQHQWRTGIPAAAIASLTSGMR